MHGFALSFLSSNVIFNSHTPWNWQIGYLEFGGRSVASFHNYSHLGLCFTAPRKLTPTCNQYFRVLETAWVMQLVDPRYFVLFIGGGDGSPSILSPRGHDFSGPSPCLLCCP